ncbi:hypothetical protein BKA61DRAFT_669313 [Leptodontidium sp. MPI-SDFR-AT-0119]|nr:hypothetical protein BKA61DRAFT_669313 [Leptodontidium sp. MPI-SDFR-AT-0119]
MREKWKATSKLGTPVDYQFTRSKIRQGLRNIVFEGVVVIIPKDVALVEAKNEDNLLTDRSRLAYWTDGSYLEDYFCGIGVVYCSALRSTWTELSWRLRGFAHTFALGFYAIAKALEIARDGIIDLASEQRPRIIVVYSDCADALSYFDRLRVTLVG